MRTQGAAVWGEPDLLLRAIRACGRTLLVVDEELRVLAANSVPEGETPACHRMLCGRDTPCRPCPVRTVFRTGKPVTKMMPRGYGECAHAFPIAVGGRVVAVGVGNVGVEEEAHLTSAFLTNLIESSVDGVITADTSGTILIFNRAAESILGYRASEVVGRFQITKLYPSPEAAREVMRLLRSEEHGGVGKIDSLHVDLVHRSGEIIPTNLSAALVRQNGREVASVGFFKDKRELLRVERELQETQIRLLQSEKMASIGRLAAGVAHQINNPLGGISMYSQLILEDLAEDHPLRPDVVRIAEDAERCKAIVKELLVFARQTKREVKPLDINRAVDQTMFLLEKQALFQNIEVVRDLDPDLPLVAGDVQQLHHVFMNLILNAADAMEGRGRLTLRTRAAEETDEVLLEIADTGCGIPPEIRSRIFDPFFTTKRVGEGTGLGLSMVYSIVQWHGGRVEMESEVGEGTTFTVRLPRRPPPGEGE